MGRVETKVAYVTGGGSGIGRASAVLLAGEGARVAVGDVDRQGGAETVAQIVNAGGDAFFLEHDVSSEDRWQAVIGEIEQRFGRLDILVNNAGVGGTGASQNPESIELADWRRINAVNLEGVFLGCKHAIAAMRRAGGGSIVNISSLAAMVATPTIAAYGAGKAGVRQFTKSVAMHCAGQGMNIRCNSIHPGIIVTPMTAGLFGIGEDETARDESYLKRIPLKDFGRPADIANAVLYLASDESRYVTGAELVVDGGLSAI